MLAYTFKRWYSNFNPNVLTDEQRDTLTAGVGQALSTSKLVQSNAGMAASGAALATKATIFKASRATAAASLQQAHADAATCNTDRAAVDAELLSYIGTATAQAKSVADLTGAGVGQRPPPPPKPAFAPPDVVDAVFFKSVKGKFKTLPHGFKKRRMTWVVEMSHDPVGPITWIAVPGTGNGRTFTGVSGTQVWVRYAMLRGTLQSAWGTPVLVTFP